MSSQFLLAVAPYAVTILVSILVPVVTYLVGRIQTNQPINQHDLLSAIVGSAVTAAEQMATQTGLNGAGKKQIAIEMIEKQLASYHLNIPTSITNALIESTVYALNASNSATTVSTPAVQATPLPLPPTDTKGV